MLPLGEFDVMISEPRATLQVEGIPSAILKIVFAIFYFVFLMQFGLWRAAADTVVLVDVQSDVLLPPRMHVTAFFIDQHFRRCCFVICLPMCQ